MARLKLTRKKAGFSLIEVLAAMLILGIMLLTLISVFIYGFNVISRSTQVAVATQICQEEVERIRNLTFDAVAALGTTFTDTKLSRLVNGQGVRAVEAGAGNDIKKLTVSVTWNYRGQSLRKDVVTYVTRMGVDKK
jgi:prepilin-type N-terminal cleavage/methylation domain-containing protein